MEGRRVHPGRGKKGRSNTGDEDIKREKLKTVLQLTLQGIPAADIASLMNVSRTTIENWKQAGKRAGLLEEVRDQLIQKLLPKSVGVYEEILDSDPEELTEKRIVKAQELRLKAARDLARGLGALQEKAATIRAEKSVDLEKYYQIQAGRRLLQDPQQLINPREEVTDGEVLADTPPSDERTHTDGENRLGAGVPAPDAENQSDEESPRRGVALVGDCGWGGGENLGGPDGAGSDPCRDQGDAGVGGEASPDEFAPVDAG